MGNNAWTEEELHALGYQEDADGVFRQRDFAKTPTRRDLPLHRDQDSGQMPKPKQDNGDEAQRSNGPKKRGKNKSQGDPQFTIEVTSYRRRNMDPDNLCPKWYIDECTRAGLIPDDSSKYVKEFKKKVIQTKGEEYTLIKIVKIK